MVRLAESDYRYAAGLLRLRIVRVRIDLSEWYDGQWVWLEGVEIGPDGQDGPLRPVLARIAALPGPEERQQEPRGSVTRASP
ncbi:hypothetical protein V2I01_38780 [Micromonospora sp. BRA006-A]|nr:hypothetical protein [Micromonospora sp. BRA006-A]